MTRYTKPKPPYAIEMPPACVDTDYDDLPTEQQERLDVMRIDTEKVVPEPQPDVQHPPVPAPPSPHHLLRDAKPVEDKKPKAKS